MATYIKPNAIKDASIEGIKIKDGTISSSKIDETVASKSYVDAQVKTVDDKTVALEAKVTNAVQVTYSELKSLRDSGKLIPGTQYRITDYTCTTTQANAKSAGHVFDIIVTADDESTLNEEARAALHSGDEYFSGCNLNAWKLWYCLDNDINRFEWVRPDEPLIGKIAPRPAGGSGTYTYSSPIFKIVFKGKAYNLEIGVRTMIYSSPSIYITKTDDYTLVVEDENNFVDDYSGISVYAYDGKGKGVIYRMIDEFGNDVPYDFKNIQFYRQWDATKSLWSTISSDNTGVPCYTFSSLGDNSATSFTDKSLTSSNVYSNVIGKYVSSNKQTLNNICFFGNNCYSNTFGNNCYSNTFGNICYSNTFGNNCHENTFKYECEYNTFGNYGYRNAFGRGCQHNIFGNFCHNNTFGNFCHNNTFGNSCGSNTFGDNCNSNTFGSNCSKNTFGDDCGNNTFGNKFNQNTFVNSLQANTFGNECFRNTFRNKCYNNTFGNNFQDNTFGNNFQYNTFGNNCSDIKLASDASATTKYNYYQHNHFGDGCKYIVLKGAETASDSQQVQNYNFAQGLQGTSSAYLTIDGKRNRTYETYISKDTDGTIKESVIAEKIDKIIEISYADLVTLRGSSKLVPGQQYRITDYTCTTTQADTKSAGHIFDIIVTADDESTLNEEARAALHTGDEYFSGCNLNAWQIWYCLDNDTARFAWADTTNGKGVIYRMIDEWNNDVPYDFKNIQFQRDWSVIAPDSGLSGTIYCYTFSVFLDGFSEGATASDESVKAKECIESNGEGFFGNNVIRTYQYIGKWLLNNIIFVTDCSSFSIYHYSNTFGDSCYSNTFGGYCYSNTFGDDCYSNTFGNYCYSNTFGNSCYSNTFGDSCYSNTFGNGCFSNTFVSGYYSNTFGNDCFQNTFGNNCNNNTFGNYCYNNTFGNDCGNNTFGNNCDSNTFGNDCGNNTFGNNCDSNTFGNNCGSNTFGNICSRNTFGNYIQESQFGDGVQYFSITTQQTTTSPTSSDVKNYIRWLIVENGVRYVNAYVTGSTSSSSQCQNVRICLGIQGVNDSNRKTFDITSCIGSKVNNVYQPTNSQTTSV